MFIIFDLFGVILTSGFDSCKMNLADLLNRTPDQIEPIYRKWEKPFDLGLINSRTFWENINKDLSTDVNWRILNKISLESYTIIPGSIELLIKYKKILPLFLLSNTRKEWFEFLNKKYNISKYFNQMFLSYEMKLLKPDIKIYKAVIKKLSASPSDILYIDDNPDNIASSSKLGITGIHFNNPSATDNLISKYICAELITA